MDRPIDTDVPARPIDKLRLVDLHAHTVVSDGTLTPTQLVDLAVRSGLAALAITDHDHVGGLDEARRAAAGRIEVVAGIELSAALGEDDVHLLGYLIDDHDRALLARLEALREARERRGVAMMEKLRALGIDLQPEDLARELHTHESAVGRPHVARALVRKGVVASIDEAFERYLARGRPGFVPKEKLTIAEAVALVHAAGGVAVLAHPGLLDEPDAVLQAGLAAGLDGVEVEHPKNDQATRARLRELAQRHGLVATGGSDFHGQNKPDVALGTGVRGNVRVTMATLEALKQRRNRGRATAR